MTNHKYTVDASIATTTGVDIGIGGTAVFVQGESADLVFTVHETTDHSTALDISGYSFKWVLYDTGSDSALVTKDTSGDISLSDAANGEVTVPLAPADTENESPATYTHELRVTDDGSGAESSVARGDFNIAEAYA